MDELRGEVVGRVLAALLGQLVHQAGELHAGLEDGRDRVLVAHELGVAAAEDDVGGVEHRAELAAGDAHHVADDQQRERLREHLDEVDLALLAEVVDHLGADRLDRVEHALELRGVNERATMPRWRAWRGSSMVMNEPKNSSASAGMSGMRHRALARSRSPAGRRLISTTSS